MTHFVLPRQAAFLLLAAVALAACVLTSVDNAPTATTPPLTLATPTAAPVATDIPLPTVEPSPTAPAPSIALLGHFDGAPAGSVSALSLAGIKTLGTNPIDVIDLPAPDAAALASAAAAHTLVITAGADWADATRAAAQQNAQTVFVGVDQPGDDALPNYYTLGGPGGRLDEEAFLAGALAGYITQARIVGAVLPSAADLDGKLTLNGFTHGLRYSCGDCKLWVIEVAPADTDTASGAAARLQNVRADVMFAAPGPAGEAALQAAASGGMRIIGVGRDYASQTDHALGSILRRPDQTLPSLVAALLAKETPAHTNPFDLASGSLSLAPTFGPDVSPATIALMNDLVAQLTSGNLDTGVDPATGDER